MAKPVKFTVREIDGRFIVNVPALYSATGKRQRLTFQTRAEAEGERKRRLNLKKHNGTSVFGLPADIAEDAKRARDLLKGFDGVTLTEAVRHYIGAMDQRSKSQPFEDLVDEFSESLERRGKSAVYLRDVRYAKGRLEPFLGGVMVSEITTQRLREIFLESKLTASGQKAVRRNMRAAFNYAIAHGYATANPFKNLVTDDAEEREIKILTPSEAKALYDAANDDLKPYIVLATWCGIRPQEARRLDWSDVKWDREWIEIKRTTSKTKRRRFVEMSANVMAMLKPYREKTGKLFPHSEATWKRRFDTAREVAGVFDDWQEDTLRHSFASYHIALHNDLDGLARQMGHSGTGTAYQHYLDAVGKKEALEFWKIGLPKAKAKSKREAAA